MQHALSLIRLASETHPHRLGSTAGNFVSWPLLEDQISRFQHNIKPYWLTPPLAKVTAAGLLAENAMYVLVHYQISIDTIICILHCHIVIPTQ